MVNDITITKEDVAEPQNTDDPIRTLDLGMFVEHTAVDVMRHDPENAIPHSEIAGRPDAGFGGTRIKFTLSFRTSDDSQQIATLVDWVRGDQTPGEYDFGVFSLEHSEFPDFNKTAIGVGTKIGGYKLVNLHLEVSHQIPDRITGYLDMQLDGKRD